MSCQADTEAAKASLQATMLHEADAIAQCGNCRRYTFNRQALSGRPPVCTCGQQHYWTGSFKTPGPGDQWFGQEPGTPEQLSTQDQGDSSDIPREFIGVEEETLNGSGFWRSCSGCYETNEGYPPKGAYFSKVFNCMLGCGCSECGGLGAVWDTTDYDAMAQEMIKDEAALRAGTSENLPETEKFVRVGYIDEQGGPRLTNDKRYIDTVICGGCEALYKKLKE